MAAYLTYNDDTLPLGVHDWYWPIDPGCYHDDWRKGNKICIFSLLKTSLFVFVCEADLYI